MANNLTPKEEFLLNPVTEHNITDAAIATFETNLRHGVKVEVPFEPKQDLHGYDHPWPGGGGKNLFNISDFWANGDILTVTSGKLKYLALDLPIGTYTISTNVINNTQSTIASVFADTSLTTPSSATRGVFLNSPRTLNVTETSNQLYIYIRVESTDGYLVWDENSFSPYYIQVELGSTATAYEPYENICPIEGYTECEVEQRGKNLFPPASNGQEVPVFIPKGTPFTASMSAQSAGAYIRWRYADGTQESLNFVNTGTDAYGRRYRSFNGCTKDIVSAFFFKNGGGLSELQIELGTTSTSYEPYQGKSVPISWKHAEGTYEFSPVQEGSGDSSPENVRPIHPGLTITRDDNTELTVYGGSITFNDDGTSSITEKYAKKVFDGSKNEARYPLESREDLIEGLFYKFPVELRNSKNGNLYCDRLANGRVDAYGHFLTDQIWRIAPYASPSLYSYLFSVPLGIASDSAELQQYLTTNPVTVVYPLAASTTYTLSTTETQRVIQALGDKVSTVIYGGTVTLNEDGSADVVENLIRKRVTTELGTVNFNEGRVRYTVADMLPVNAATTYDDDKYKCNVFPKTKATSIPGVSFTASNDLSNAFILFQGLESYGITNTLVGWNEFIADNEVYVTYQLATPIAYHFPNIGQLKAFLGTNNIWSDIGNVNVKYLTQNSETGMEYRGDRALELRRRAMLADAPTIHTTVGSSDTGGLASFKSYIKAPVKKIEIPFGPKQNLHGYDRPWPGDSAGLLPVAEKATKTVNGTTIVSDSGSFLIQSSQMVSGTKIRFNLTRSFTVPSDTNNYKICFNGGASGATELYLTFVYDDGIEYSVSPLYGDDRVMSPVPSSMAGKTIVAIEFYAHSDIGSVNNRTISPQIVPIDVENGYYQGSNICPISGWTGANISGIAKNFANVFNDPSNPDKGCVSSGGGTTPFVYDTTEQAYYTTNHRAVKFNLKPGTYTISFWAKQKTTNYPYAVLGFGNNIFPANITSYATVWTRYDRQLTLATETQIGGVFYRTIWIRDFQIEKSNTVSDYEPYQGKTLPINWQSEAGTIYGGTVTFNEDGSADVVSTHVTYSLQPSAWTWMATATCFKIDRSALSPRYKVFGDNVDAKVADIISNKYKPNTYNYLTNGVNNSNYSVGIREYNAQWLALRTDGTNTVLPEECQITLPLETPQTYHFTNLEELKVWLGENNFWCDISDDISVKYWNRGFGN